MEIYRASGTLKEYSKKNKLTAEDVLNVFYDLCEDVKDETGSPIDKADIGDEDNFVLRLGWASRLIARLYNRNQDILGSPEHKAVWEKADAKRQECESALEELAKETAVWKKKVDAADEALKSWEARKDELDEMQAAYQRKTEQTEKYDQMEKSYQDIRRQMDEERMTRLPALKQQREQLIADRDALKADLEQAMTERNQAQDEYDLVEQRMNEARSKKEDLERQIDDTKRRIRAASGEAMSFEEQLRQLQAQEEEEIKKHRQEWQDIEDVREQNRKNAEARKKALEDEQTAAEEEAERLTNEKNNIILAVTNAKEREAQAKKDLEAVRVRYQKPKDEMAARYALLMKIAGVQAQDPILQDEWNVDTQIVNGVSRALEEKRRAAEEALRGYQDQYGKLVRILETGGLEE